MKLTFHFQLSQLPDQLITESDVYVLRYAGDLKICKTPPPPTGSYISPKPVCHTKREWDEIEVQKRDQKIPDRPRGGFIPN
jgi:hypothetical protein